MDTDKVRLFLEAVVGKEEVEKYIEYDHWIEFPTRSLESILERYESLLRENKSE